MITHTAGLIFTQLILDVQRYDNKTAKQIKDILGKTFKKEELKDHDAIVGPTESMEAFMGLTVTTLESRRLSNILITKIVPLL